VGESGSDSCVEPGGVVLGAAVAARATTATAGAASAIAVASVAMATEPFQRGSVAKPLRCALMRSAAPQEPQPFVVPPRAPVVGQ
jgi:hypothetical protein